MPTRSVVLESPTGVGKLHHAGGVVESIRYEITVTQDIHVSTTFDGTSQVPGLKDAYGSLRGKVPIHIFGIEAELELEDGRRWKCLVQGRGQLDSLGPITGP